MSTTTGRRNGTAATLDPTILDRTPPHDLDAFNEELAKQEQEQDELDGHRQSVREALADIEWDEDFDD